MAFHVLPDEGRGAGDVEVVYFAAQPRIYLSRDDGPDAPKQVIVLTKHQRNELMALLRQHAELYP